MKIIGSFEIIVVHKNLPSLEPSKQKSIPNPKVWKLRNINNRVTNDIQTCFMKENIKDWRHIVFPKLSWNSLHFTTTTTTTTTAFSLYLLYSFLRDLHFNVIYIFCLYFVLTGLFHLIGLFFVTWRFHIRSIKAFPTPAI